VPEVGLDDGLLRVEVAGVCGSDPKYFAGTVPGRRNWPFILGHEIVGRIEAVGRHAAQRWGVAVGDRVVVDPHAGCGQCAYCASGNARMCAQRTAYGGKVSSSIPPHLWGGYAELVYLPARAGVHRIPDEVPTEEAVFAGILGDSIRWVRDVGGVTIGDTVVIQGVGPQGLCAVVAARASGAATVIATGLGRDRRRLEMALELGADAAIDVEREPVVEAVQRVTGGRLADVVVELSGAPSAVQACLELARPMGSVVIAGLTGDREVPLRTDQLAWKELRWQGVFACEGTHLVRALQLIATRRYPFARMISHRFSLDQAEAALDLVGGAGGELEQAIKVVIALDGRHPRTGAVAGEKHGHAA
jgi:alcohol dehydrogenase